MRFDLEIPGTDIDVTYISEGARVPSGSVPLYYVNIDHKNKLPRDFLTINENIVEDPSSELVYDEQSGPTFAAKGTKFAITHITKYSSEYNTHIPIFHKAVINDSVSEFSVRIVDHLGGAINRDSYIVVEGSESTTIYINDIGKTLFIEYTSGNEINSKMLSLYPVYSEMTLEEILENGENIPDEKFKITDGYTVETSFSGTLYIKYVHDIKLLQGPIANIDDAWNLEIYNTKFKVPDPNDGGITYTYEIPEFYIQNATDAYAARNVTDKKCSIVSKNLVKTPSRPDKSNLDKINIFVKDYFTKEIKYAFTTNQSLNGVKYNDTYYSMASDWNNDGVVKLPINITTTDIVTASYVTLNEYYKFRFLNLNTMNQGKDLFFGIYLKPNPQEVEIATYFATIGKYEDPSLQTQLFRQGRGFSTTEEYFQFIDDNHCYHIALVGTSSSSQKDIMDMIDIRSIGGEIYDKEAACRITPDVFYKDIIDKNISVPTNDILLAKINTDKLVSRKIIEIDKNNLIINEGGKEELAKIQEMIQSNLIATTQLIIMLNAASEVIESDTWNPTTINNSFIGSVLPSEYSSLLPYGEVVTMAGVDFISSLNTLISLPE